MNERRTLSPKYWSRMLDEEADATGDVVAAHRGQQVRHAAAIDPVGVLVKDAQVEPVLPELPERGERQLAGSR